MNHLISLKEQNKEYILNILSLAQKLKSNKQAGKFAPVLAGKTMIMLFQKTSTRTRLSFESAMTELGGHAIYLDARSSQMSLSDFKDEIKAVMGFGNILVMRALKASDVELAASFNKIPVIDGCSEKYHPCQALGDILTMAEASGGVEKIGKVVWLGAENNVSNTLKLACAKLGIDIVICSPEANSPSIDVELNKLADQTGHVTYTNDTIIALNGAKFVHTDTWMDMEYFADGKIKPEFASEYERKKKLFFPYQLSAEKINLLAPQAKIMHCMPCHVGYEITRDAIDHSNSLIFPQAENRLHIQKAIILWLLGGY